MEEIIGQNSAANLAWHGASDVQLVCYSVPNARKQIESESQLSLNEDSSSGSKKIDKNNSLLIKNTFSHKARAEEEVAPSFEGEGCVFPILAPGFGL